jgi:hypothetical protein
LILFLKKLILNIYLKTSIVNNIKVMASLSNFLNNHKTNDNKYTHTSLIGGKWIINVNEYPLFFKLLSTELQNGTELYLTERHLMDRSPIVIDMDFKYDVTDKKLLDKSPMTKSMIKNIVNNLTKILKQHFDSTTNFFCVVLKRPTPYECNQYIKDGLHICFPYIITSFDYQYALRLHYIENHLENDIKNIPNVQENGLGEVYDKSVIEKNNWMVYGCTKKNVRPYTIYNIYNKKVPDIKLIQAIDMLSIRNKTILSDVNDKDDIYTTFMNKYISTLNKHRNKKHKNNKDDDSLSDETEDYINTNVNYNIVKQLLYILSEDRLIIFKKWMKIGYVLFNSQYVDSDKDNNYFKLWKEWSKTCKKKY